MSNPFAQPMNSPTAAPANMLQNRQQDYRRFIENPVAALAQVYNIPDQNMTPEQAYQHLVQSKQIDNKTVTMAQMLLPQLSQMLGSR